MDPVFKNALGLKFCQAIRAHCKPLYLSCKSLILKISSSCLLIMMGSLAQIFTFHDILECLIEYSIHNHPANQEQGPYINYVNKLGVGGV